MKNLIILLLVTFVQCIYSQSLEPEALSNAGDHMETSTLKLDWTLGLNESESIESGDIMLTQGFQQANLKVSTSVVDVNDHIWIKAYPNPTEDWVIIQKDIPDVLNYRITTLKGDQIKEGVLKSELSYLDWGSYPAGIYLIGVSANDKLSSWIKVEKLK